MESFGRKVVLVAKVLEIQLFGEEWYQHLSWETLLYHMEEMWGFLLQGGKKMPKLRCFTEILSELRMLPAHGHLLPDGQGVFPSGMENWLILWFFPSIYRVRMGLDPTLCSRAQKQNVQILEGELKASSALRGWKEKKIFWALHQESHILSKSICYFYHPEWNL